MSSTLHFKHPGNAEYPTIWANVTLGVLSKKCKGMGVCSITLEPPLDVLNESRSYQVWIQLTEDKRLRFIFEKEFLSESSTLTFFGRKHFKVDETLEVPQKVLKKLGLSNYSIWEGEYMIEKTTTAFIVEF